MDLQIRFQEILSSKLKYLIKSMIYHFLFNLKEKGPIFVFKNHQFLQKLIHFLFVSLFLPIITLLLHS